MAPARRPLVPPHATWYLHRPVVALLKMAPWFLRASAGPTQGTRAREVGALRGPKQGFGSPPAPQKQVLGGLPGLTNKIRGALPGPKSNALGALPGLKNEISGALLPGPKNKVLEPSWAPKQALEAFRAPKKTHGFGSPPGLHKQSFASPPGPQEQGFVSLPGPHRRGFGSPPGPQEKGFGSPPGPPRTKAQEAREAREARGPLKSPPAPRCKLQHPGEQSVAHC